MISRTELFSADGSRARLLGLLFLGLCAVCTQSSGTSDKTKAPRKIRYVKANGKTIAFYDRPSNLRKQSHRGSSTRSRPAFKEQAHFRTVEAAFNERVFSIRVKSLGNFYEKIVAHSKKSEAKELEYHRKTYRLLTGMKHQLNDLDEVQKLLKTHLKEKLSDYHKALENFMVDDSALRDALQKVVCAWNAACEDHGWDSKVVSPGSDGGRTRILDGGACLPAAISAGQSVQCNAMMHLSVQLSEERTIYIIMDQNDKIEKVKHAIQDEEGIVPDAQRLIYAGKELDDKKTLRDYTISENSTIFLVLKVNGNIGGRRLMSQRTIDRLVTESIRSEQS